MFGDGGMICGGRDRDGNPVPGGSRNVDAVVTDPRPGNHAQLGNCSKYLFGEPFAASHQCAGSAQGANRFVFCSQPASKGRVGRIANVEARPRGGSGPLAPGY